MTLDVSKQVLGHMTTVSWGKEKKKKKKEYLMSMYNGFKMLRTIWEKSFFV